MPKAQPESLPELRKQLDLIDRELLECAQKRLAIVSKIFEAKAAEGVSLFDRERERQVFERARHAAKEVGLDPEVAESIMQALVYASHGLQQSLGQQRETKADTRFVIVGGKGQMGIKLSSWLVEQGFTVSALDKGDKLEPAAFSAADVVILSVPMSEVVRVAQEVGPLLREDALLCDINSLKSEICSAMAESFGGEVLGLHPMFGPTVSSPRRQKVVACKVRDGERSAWMLGLLRRLGFEVIETTPEKHDRFMGVIQVLTHFSTMVMGRALERSGVTLDETLPFMSPIYRVELAFVGRLFAQDPELYASIEMDNKLGPELRRVFIESAAELKQICDEGNNVAFEKAFASIRDYFSAFSSEGMLLSDIIIDTVVRQP
ncbi:MAG: bifunctional chorismate mutase/prephenate dehydrogenase [Bdellovibrionales bacterium]|nr:bifunctional chorismate mutase/prephenate dehydrogenase [Bdellovibrionales bacterium]